MRISIDNAHIMSIIIVKLLITEAMNTNNIKLRAARKSANLTQQEAAQLLNVDQTAISQWETGLTMPRTDKLPDIAKIYRCTIDDLFRTEAENDEAGLQR